MSRPLKPIHILGRKNSGKTTLIVELVRHLAAQGFRVGTIKHTHHHHELDTPGKDSHRHREAGADVVGILSRGMTAVFRPVDQSKQIENQYDHLAPLFADCDLVLVEGDVQAKALKIEVWRAATSARSMAQRDGSILAVVTDDVVDAEVPVWSRSDVPAIATQLLALVGHCELTNA